METRKTMNKQIKRQLRSLVLSCLAATAVHSHAANPIVPGWYADPEIRIFNGVS